MKPLAALAAQSLGDRREPGSLSRIVIYRRRPVRSLGTCVPFGDSHPAREHRRSNSPIGTGSGLESRLPIPTIATARRELTRVGVAEESERSEPSVAFRPKSWRISGIALTCEPLSDRSDIDHGSRPGLHGIIARDAHEGRRPRPVTSSRREVPKRRPCRRVRLPTTARGVRSRFGTHMAFRLRSTCRRHARSTLRLALEPPRLHRTLDRRTQPSDPRAVISLTDAPVHPITRYGTGSHAALRDGGE